MASSNPNNTQNIPINVCPETSIQAGVVYPSNQNQQHILQPISNNQNQQQLWHGSTHIAQPFGVEHWWRNNTSPNDPRTPRSLYRQNSQALITAQNTQYGPQGQPVSEFPRPWGGYQVEGEWHIGYLQQQLQQRQQRPNPDVNPMWTRD